MGIHTQGVPRRVRSRIDGMDTGQLADLIMELDIPDRDMPESDLYDWMRQRIYDWLYDPAWTEPTDEAVREFELSEARARAADAARVAKQARAHVAALEAERS